MSNEIDEKELLFYCTGDNNDISSYIFKRCDTYIGFGTKQGHDAICAFSIIGFILNFFFLLYQIIKIKKHKDKKKKNIMRTMFLILPIFDCIISLYWIISSFYFSQAKDIKDSRAFCTVLSIFYQMCFTFQFIMINCILYYFKKINMNPMEGILKSKKNMIKYILLSIIISVIIGLLSLFINIGRSPMNTCFINTYDTNEYSILTFILPICSIFFAIGQIIIDLCFEKGFITDRVIRILYKKNSYYVLIFCFLHFPLIMYLVIVSFSHDMNETSYEIFTYIITLFTSMIPFIIGFIRYFQGLTKINCIKNFLRNNSIYRSGVSKSLANNKNIKKENVLLIENDPFEWLESHVLKCFMRDILIGIISALKRSKKYGDHIKLINGGKSMELEKYKINLDTLRDLKLGDETLNDIDYLDIKIVNYAPRSFAYLRQIEKINIDEMIESFLPKNNSQGLEKSQGKSGSFFISTDDNKYMVKSLKSDEIDLIRNGFLSKYIRHIELTKNESLLCRLYGMYNIMMAKKEFCIIVMRNIIGDFKDNEVVRFDLKGSTFGRKAEFNFDKSNLLKDINFDEIEKNIMLFPENLKNLRNIAKKDSKFLSKSELMDYSLLLVKLTLNKEEDIDVFGKNINAERNKAIKEINSDFKNIINNNKNEEIIIENEEIGENDENINVKMKGEGKIKDIRHYSQFLFPSLRPGAGYIISIIDYFQYFNFFKVVESNVISNFKTGFNKKKNNTISCVNPKLYSERFINYFNNLTDIKNIKKLNILPKIEENEEENNIDNEREEDSKEDKKEEETENILEKVSNIVEDNEINVDLKDEDEPNNNSNFSLRITIVNKNLAKKEDFLKNNEEDGNIKHNSTNINNKSKK